MYAAEHYDCEMWTMTQGMFYDDDHAGGWKELVEQKDVMRM